MLIRSYGFQRTSIENEPVYIEFIGKTINSQLSDHSNDLWKSTSPLDCKFSNDEKQKAFTWSNTLLRQVKSYVDINLYSAKLNVIDPKKIISRTTEYQLNSIWVKNV